MGIPKFFRFMSERYPLISKLIKENNVPEFDNLYLDVNGIIHNCSHPDDGASFRITEEAIFLAIFAYISHLFAVIKPKKVFFVAIDGVAPRAKMNQQRSRRFRTAKEMKAIVDKAKAKGEEIPEGDGFDSNCITPGTPFMARLSSQLKYFFAKKVSEDADWRGVEIVLSGHEVPGEGEHKIMEYIRLSKAQVGYNPNVRHCLYGLDADLIMLGLLSHDPHFCLLREEVVFGPKGSKGKAKGLELQNFFLMHLSLFREYLDLEFSSLRTLSPPLPFEYDLERIIDDFILLNIFVGNDFLPHLPGLHINEGAIGRLFEIYKRILPAAGGYLNDHGTLNVKRLQLVLNELTVFETEHFEHEFADASWFKGKQTKKIDSMEKARLRNKFVITQEQRKIFFTIKAFVLENITQLSPNARQILPSTINSRDRRFLTDLADELHLDIAYDEFNEQDEAIIVLSFNEQVLNLARVEEEEGDSDDSEAPEWVEAIHRVLKKFEKAEVAQEFNEAEQENSHAKQLELKMTEWKKEYYKEKLEFEYSDEVALHDLAYRYIEGLQWVLKYYYSGVASWGWFYNYHYAPKISDLCHAGTYEFNFELGTPFHPFEQLMGVLPDLSSSHIPPAFRDLMSDPLSPIIDFYPVNFIEDLNGKKQDWEAIVKIPFIDEKRLLKTMRSREHKLSAEELSRNVFGNSWKFTFDPTLTSHYPSSLPGFFPDLIHCHCRMEMYDLPTLTGGLTYLPGLVQGALLGKEAISGFPSMHTIPFSGALGFHGVSVFQGDSRKETMVITLDNQYEALTSEALALSLVGHRTFVGYPFLQEAEIVGISDELFRYSVEPGGVGKSRIVPVAHRPEGIMAWKRTSDRLEHGYSKRFGVIIGNVDVVVHAKLLKGLSTRDDGSAVKEFEMHETEYAVQTCVTDVFSEDVRFVERPPLAVELEFPEKCKVFFLGSQAYGVPAAVVGHEKGEIAVRIAYFPGDSAENQRFRESSFNIAGASYYPSHSLNRELRMSGLALSKLTSSMMISLGDAKLNIGLNLKFESKGLKVLGYSRKGNAGWEFSTKAIELIREYNAKFPEIAEALERKKDLTNANDFFPRGDADVRIKELKAFLSEKGVRDFDKVPLFSEQLDGEAVMALQTLADTFTALKSAGNMKQAVIKSLPRQALLKPSHAASRLSEQRFALRDRVLYVSDAGGIPLAAKGTVIGIQVGFIDVVFDVQFMNGSTLGDRCSAYRGQSVAPTALLNLTDQQYVTASSKQAAGTGVHSTQYARSHPPPAVNGNAHFARGPRGGPSIVPARGLPAGGFHPAPASNRGSFQNASVKLLRNPAARPFDKTNYLGAARGDAPAQPLVTTPAALVSHQQQLGAALGIPAHRPSVQNGRGGFPARGSFTPGFGRGGMAATNGHHPLVNNTPATRGALTSIRGAVSVGRGYAIPPPDNINGRTLSGRGRGSRGRGPSAAQPTV